MNLLILGNGGREHAIGLKLSQSALNPKLFFAPGNPGVETLGTRVVDCDTHDDLVRFAKENQIDLTIVGPEQPLVDGIVDRFEDEGLGIFGPHQEAAMLEGSKAFSKRIMAKYEIPTAHSKMFTDTASALRYLREQSAPIVIKASGLAAGKGVVVCQTIAEAEQAVSSMFKGDPPFGDAGREVVIEEFMEGEEASVFLVTDGTKYSLLPTAQDHKRLLEGDQGPNTGGMGAYTPSLLLTPERMARVEQEIVEPLLAGMRKEKKPYRGFLYIGLMIHEESIKVVEFNCRLGDPEAQVVLPVWEADLLQVIVSAMEGDLSSAPSQGSSGVGAVVVLASEGYPGAYQKSLPISGVPEAESIEGVHVIQAGTAERDGSVVTAGGRVLGVVAQGTDLAETIDRAYAGVAQITYEGKMFRRDIGHQALSVSPDPTDSSP